jgi:hypothetical protein
MASCVVVNSTGRFRRVTFPPVFLSKRVSQLRQMIDLGPNRNMCAEKPPFAQPTRCFRLLDGGIAQTATTNARAIAFSDDCQLAEVRISITVLNVLKPLFGLGLWSRVSSSDVTCDFGVAVDSDEIWQISLIQAPKIQPLRVERFSVSKKGHYARCVAERSAAFQCGDTEGVGPASPTNPTCLADLRRSACCE